MQVRISPAPYTKLREEVNKYNFMGNTHVILVWTKFDDNWEKELPDYHYNEYYRGESFMMAVFNFLMAKKFDDFGCVKWEYR